MRVRFGLGLGLRPRQRIDISLGLHLELGLDLVCLGVVRSWSCRRFVTNFSFFSAPPTPSFIFWALSCCLYLVVLPILPLSLSLFVLCSCLTHRNKHTRATSAAAIRRGRKGRNSFFVKKKKKATQDKTRQDKTWHDKTRHDKTRQGKARQDKARPERTRHKATQLNITHLNITQLNTT